MAAGRSECDISQRLALDQQQVGGSEGIVDRGLWRAVDERRDPGARQLGSADP